MALAVTFTHPEEQSPAPTVTATEEHSPLPVGLVREELPVGLAMEEHSPLPADTNYRAQADAAPEEHSTVLLAPSPTEHLLVRQSMPAGPANRHAPRQVAAHAAGAARTGTSRSVHPSRHPRSRTTDMHNLANVAAMHRRTETVLTVARYPAVQSSPGRSPRRTTPWESVASRRTRRLAKDVPRLRRCSSGWTQPF